MQRLCLFFIALVSSLVAVTAAEKIDTMSYVLGHQYSLGLMAGKNDLMQNRTDFKEYIRGLEENLVNLSQMNDSSYMMSYYLGAMEAVFKIDGMIRKTDKDMPPIPCIVAGLRKVGDGNISLPADTVAAMALINRYSREGGDLDDETTCRFYTAYGVMKAYQPGVQEYLNGLKPGTACRVNRQALATGMADVLESADETPETAYDLGRLIARSVFINTMDDVIDTASFIAGAKAALQLGKQILPRDEVEAIMERQFQADFDEIEHSEQYANIEKSIDLQNQIEVEFFTPYKVDWHVTAGTVADVGDVVSNVFFDVVSSLNIPDTITSGALIVQCRDDDGRIYDAATAAIREHQLPEGYKWFCDRDIERQTSVGIMLTNPLFKADVDNASVEPNRFGTANVSWSFGASDELKWAEFTGRNIGKHVAVEVNGRFSSAPRVNQQISGGRCAVSNLTPDQINLLFKNAKKIVPPEPDDPFEVIIVN